MIVGADAAHEYTVSARLDELVSNIRSGVRLGTDDVVLLLGLGRTIRGVLVDATGAALAGKFVRLKPSHGDPTPMVRTDEDGAFWEDRLWSHSWAIPEWTSAEGVKVSDYHISPGL